MLLFFGAGREVVPSHVSLASAFASVALLAALVAGLALLVRWGLRRPEPVWLGDRLFYRCHDGTYIYSSRHVVHDPMLIEDLEEAHAAGRARRTPRGAGEAWG